MKTTAFWIIFLSFFFAFSQEVRQYHTTWLQGEIPVIDGKLDDPAWDQVEWGGDFIQRMPVDGAAPSQQTKFKILYDAKYLYFGIKALDTEPEKVARRMSRRDGFEGDFVEVNIDSYADKRTAFSFSASASGVKGDEYVSNNGDNWDATWDPIWFLKTSLDEEGWIAEFKIPLSQLRFADKEEHTWGIEIMRNLFRKEERSYWQPIPQDAPGWVHLFGELKGIKGIRPQKQLEILPYVVAKTERYPQEEGDPFLTGRDQSVNAGIDAKIGLTSDITLDLTVNPDFGQVEADPSQVNLSAFQLFFREQRPFFLEGNNILNFGLTQSQAGGPFNNDNLFYSRRIGAVPSYSPEDEEDVAYTDRIRNTRILGAAKLTGKNKSGFSWGVLESLTNNEKLEVQDTLGGRRRVAVEPMTNYAVGRVQQDINKGNALIGAMFTSTNRVIRDDHLNFLHANAYTGGIDFTQNFNDRNYYLSVNTAFSHVQGAEEALMETQTASERYFQRIDNDHREVDSTLTSLSGTSASLAFGKKNGNIIFQTGATYRSPGFEANDVGFLVQSDYFSQWSWGQYRILKPFSVFRSYRLNANQYLTWDFDGRFTQRSINVNTHTQFKNYWWFGVGSTVDAERVSNADLRGGPSIRYPGGINYFIYMGTNEQKKLAFSIERWHYKGFKNYGDDHGFWAQLRYQPMDALRLTVEPSVSWFQTELQYVDSYEFNGFSYYLLGTIDQITYRASFRVNYNLTPNLSLEFWGQPFISTGEYFSFKETINPSGRKFSDRFAGISTEILSFSEGESSYFIDRDLDGIAEYEFSDPNFNVLQFRSNFVMRWEYIPGSTLFLVWTVNGSDSHDSRNNSFQDLTKDLVNLESTNIFLIKYTYRFIL